MTLYTHLIQSVTTHRSGFRYPLHKHTGKGAWLSIKDGLENMYREHPSLSAEWLGRLTTDDIAHLYNLSAINADGTPTGLELLIQHLTNVANEVWLKGDPGVCI